MLQTAWAIVKKGKIVLLQDISLPEGAKLIVTLLGDDESQYWSQASQRSLSEIWENAEDDVYAELLAE